MSDTNVSVRWEGRGKEGEGHITTTSLALQDFPYGFGSRFNNDARGTNPEELLGAAHAACFTMAFSFACDAEGFSTEKLFTGARVTLDKDALGYHITAIHLTLRARVPGMTDEVFQRLAEKTKKICPISRALAVPNVLLDAKLISG